MLEIQGPTGFSRGPKWLESSPAYFEGSVQQLLLLREEAIAFGIRRQAERGPNSIHALANSDFTSWMGGNEGCHCPSDGAKTAWAILCRAIPMARGTLASAPIRYREETADGKEWTDWTYLDGINERGAPVRAPRPRSSGPCSKATRRERAVEARLRESGLGER